MQDTSHSPSLDQVAEDFHKYVLTNCLCLQLITENEMPMMSSFSSKVNANEVIFLS